MIYFNNNIKHKQILNTNSKLRWLNKESEDILYNGYIDKSISVEQRIENICNYVANDCLGKPELSSKFQEIIKNGWSSLSSPIWSNVATDKGMGISCVVGDTWINTNEGGKKAKDIKLGDLVLTHKNRFRKVTDIIPTKDKGDIYKLKVGTRMTNLYITGNHLVLTNLGWVRVDDLDKDKHLIAVNGEVDHTDKVSYSTSGSEDDLTYCPIHLLEKTDMVEDVYDFTVEEDHSFSCAGVVVHNCFNSHVPDNLDSITSALSEVAIQTKMGGGTSGYFGDLRASGTVLSSGAKSSGAVSFIKWFESITQTVMQNGTRRGYFAAYLNIDHPEIEQFLRVKDPTSDIQDINTAVTIPEGWMEKMIEGDKEKRDVWAKVLESRRRKGIPYIFFDDNVNKSKPQVYKDKGIDIKSSNLCVAPYTQILTKQGYRDIYSYENQEVEIWNGEEWSEVIVKKTAKNVPLLRITTNTGYQLDCSYEHQFYVKKGGKVIMVEAQNLKEDDDLIDFKLPIVDGKPVVYRDIDYELGDSLHVVEVEKLPYNSDTYCYTEHKRGMGMFNGILTGQCSEVLLESNDDESFVCCLSSMNLELYDEWKDTDAVYLMTMFLDGIMTDFINKVKDVKHMVRNYNFAKNQRALGLG